MALAAEDDFGGFDEAAAPTGLSPSTPSSPMPTIASHRPIAALSATMGPSEVMARRILILGGTTEARLARPAPLMHATV